LPELAEAIGRHREHQAAAGGLEARRRRTLRERLLAEVRQRLLRRIEETDGARVESVLDRVLRRELTPGDAADGIIEHLRSEGRS
jgi:putative protein kinase ArgK-like GTPase of G3E family